jgi:hypothetical protein
MVSPKGDREKYTGAILHPNGHVYCIPISAESILEYNPKSNTVSFFGELGVLDHAYSGGVYYSGDGCIYGFPRNANSLLKIDAERRTVKEIPIGTAYKSTGIHGAHHYGGALYKNCLYCAPKKGNNILKIDLNTYQTEELAFQELQYREYSGAVLHPNGKIYFMPCNSEVAALDPETEELRLIGDKMNGLFYNGYIFSDNNIYSVGWGAVLKISVDTEDCAIVCKLSSDNVPLEHFYDAPLYTNGKMYVVPSGSDRVYEYSPTDNVCKVIGRFNDGIWNNIKWATGVALKDCIFLAPCFGRFAAKMVFKPREA